MGDVLAILDRRAQENGLKPLSELGHSDARTLLRRGLGSQIQALYATLLQARTHLPPCPYDSEVTADRMLANDLDHAVRLVVESAELLGVDLAEPRG